MPTVFFPAFGISSYFQSNTFDYKTYFTGSYWIRKKLSVLENIAFIFDLSISIKKNDFLYFLLFVKDMYMGSTHRTVCNGYPYYLRIL